MTSTKALDICKICGSELQIAQIGDGFKVSTCFACADKKETEYRESQERARIQQIEFNLKNRIPPIYHGMCFDTYRPTPENKIALQEARRLVSGFKKQDDEKQDDKELSKKYFLTLSGAAGVGKTALAICCMVEAIKISKKSLFLRSVDYFSNIKAGFKDGSDSEYIKDVRQVPFLVLDDLFLSGNELWQTSNVYDLIDYRHQYCLPTVITSNLDGKSIAQTYGARIASRLKGAGAVVSITGKDWRL